MEIIVYVCVCVCVCVLCISKGGQKGAAYEGVG